MADANREIACFKSNPGFPDNKVSTTKYTWLTFVPKNLMEQYMKFGNQYFTVISLLMWLGEHTTLFIGTIKAFSTVATLAAMMMVTAVMALLDDRQRGKADTQINSQKAKTLNPDGSEKEKLWSEVQVGDVLKISADQEFPADVVLIESSQPEGVVWVSTANLDGESNLKKKEALKETQVGGFAKLGGVKVVAEAPSENIYGFWGQHKDGSDQEPPILGPDQLLLRGTMLRNTKWVKGVVVYTGSETRMVKNSRPAPTKQSNIEKDINKVMLLVLAAQFLLAMVSNITFLFTKDKYQAYWYINVPELRLPDIVAYLLTFVVLYSNLMPISLYPSMEVVNVAHAYFIKNDFQMLWRPSKANPPQEGATFAAVVRSSNLCQELGQIDYVFSDKTGTLTQNVMEFKRASVLGATFGQLGQVGLFEVKLAIDQRLAKGDAKDKAVVDRFWEILGVCHTVVAAEAEGGGTAKKYEAESPDEKSLVETAAEMGWAFQGRSGTTMKVKRSDGAVKTYEHKAENKFDSTRKRMSVVVEHEGKYLLLVKGADNVMLDPERSAGDQTKLKEQLKEFSEEGLRTLVIGWKELTKEVYDDWMDKYRKAQLENNEKAMADVAELIEKDLSIVGATAIEDKLQERVPDAIENIRKAGVKLWVLTGDKLETARNIGRSAKVLGISPDHMIEKTLDVEDMGLSSRSSEAEKTVAYAALEKRLKELRTEFREAGDKFAKLEAILEVSSAADRAARRPELDKLTTALIVTGATLAVVMDPTTNLKQLLVDIAATCRIVIACRVSPLQKAEMVTLVRDNIKLSKGGLEDAEPVTLAIGDGANDVPMIQAAHVGIGIAGREGRQAVNNSDVAIGQFHYLERLLLVHGRWNYRRVSKFALFTFWRNAVQVLMIFYYTFLSGFSGTSLFEDWIRLSFNFLCSLPIIAVGCFDQDVTQEAAIAEPDLYQCGRKGLDLNNKKMAYTLLSAVSHSMILLGVTTMSFPGLELMGAGDYYTYGTAVYSGLLLDMSYRVLFLAFTHNRYTTISVVGSIALYAFYLFAYADSLRLITEMLEPNMWDVPRHLMCWPFWVMTLAVPLLAMTFDVFIQEVSNALDPYYFRIMQMRKLEQASAPPWSERTWSNKMSAELQDAKEFIETSDFAQQDVPNWTSKVRKTITPTSGPLTTFKELPNSTWFSFMVAVLMFSLACLLQAESAAQSQLRIHYSGYGKQRFSLPLDPLGTGEPDVVKVTDECGSKTTCNIQVRWPHQDEALKDIHVFYVLGPFYQNYNNYMKSEVPKELMGREVAPAAREQRCPKISREDGDGNALVPCGMKAFSFFNDTFHVEGLPIDKTSSGWDSDRARYRNPVDYGRRPDTKWLYDRYPNIDHIREEGVDTPEFVEWMRPAALWRVWNKYGTLEQQDDKAAMLKQNSMLNITIHNHYPAIPDGYKHLVLTTLGPFGGRHHGFSYLLYIASAACFLLGLLAMQLRRCKCCCHAQEEDSDYEPLHGTASGDYKPLQNPRPDEPLLGQP